MPCPRYSLTIVLYTLSRCFFPLQSPLKRGLSVEPAPLQLRKQSFLYQLILQFLHCPYWVLFVSYLNCNHIVSLLFRLHLIIPHYSQMSRGSERWCPRYVVSVVCASLLLRASHTSSPTSDPLIVYRVSYIAA